MLSTRASSMTYTARPIVQLGRSLTPLKKASLLTYPAGLRLASISESQRHGQSARAFSTTSRNQLRDFFPAEETELIRRTPPAWPHHGYSEKDMLAVVPAHREPKTFGDWVAWKLVRTCRWGMDFVTGLSSEQQVDMKHSTTATKAAKPLTEAQWVRTYLNLTALPSTHLTKGN